MAFGWPLARRYWGLPLALVTVLLAARSVEAEGGVLWPARARAIERELEGDDVVRRRVAAAELDRLAPSLAERGVLLALADPDREVRLAAAKAATALPVRSAAREVKSWLGDPDAGLRVAAIRVLSLALDDANVAEVITALSDAEPLVRLEAARTLGQAPELLASSAALGLEGSLSDAAEEVRAESVRALGRLAQMSSVLGVVQRLRDEDEEVRVAAAVALGALGGDAAVGPLLLALGDRVAAVRVASITSLGELGSLAASPAADERITRQMNDAESVAERRAAARALLAMGSPAALDAVMAQLADEALGSGVGALVVRELGRRSARSALVEEALSRCLQRAAGNALGRCADALAPSPRFFELVLAPAVRRRLAPERLLRIATSTQRHHPELTLLALEQLEPEGDRAITVERFDAATGYLATLPELPPGAVEPLVRAFGAEGLTPEARGAVLALTAKTKPGPDLALVRRALTATVPAVVEGAVLALVAHTPLPAEALRLMGSPDPVIRRAALIGAERARRVDLTRLAMERLELGGGVARSPLTQLLLFDVPGLTKDDEARILALSRGTTGGLRDRLLELLVRAGAEGSAARAAYESGGAEDRLTLVAFAARHLAAGQVGAGDHNGSSGNGGAGQAFRRDLGLLAARSDDPRLTALAPRLLDPARDAALLAELADRSRSTAERAAALGRLGQRAKAEPCALLAEGRLGLKAVAFGLLGAEQACDGATLGDYVRLERESALRELAARALRRVKPDAQALRSCAAYEVSPAVARACSGEAPDAPLGDGAVLLTDALGGGPLVRARVALLDGEGRLVITLTDRAGRFPSAPNASLLDPRFAH